MAILTQIITSRWKFPLALLTGIAFLLGPVSPASAAAADVSAPVLVSSTVTPTTVNIAAGAATVKVSARITDATSVKAPTIVMSHDPTGQSQGFGSMVLVSGTAKDGTWERSMTIPKGAAPGGWEVTLYPLADSIGNSGSFKTLTTITVTGALADVSAPVLVSSTVTPTTVNIAAGAATVKVSARITDATSVKAPTIVMSHDPTGQSQGFGSMVLVSGTAKDGTWERSMTIPKGAAPGGWEVTLYPLADSIGNSGSFKTLTTITVNNTLQLSATPVPKITGTTIVGSTLTATAGTWSPTPVTLKYQWYRSGTAITGATTSTYKLTGTDAAKSITIKVTGSKTGYTPIAKTSAPTTTVKR